MMPNELATLLNVSQGQINRCIHEDKRPTEYEMGRWQSEMREAEMWLRHWGRNEHIGRTTDSDCDSKRTD